MQRLNRYYRRSRITEAKFRPLARHFALDLCASNAAQLTGLSHRSVITIFGKIRRRIAEEGSVAKTASQVNFPSTGHS